MRILLSAYACEPHKGSEPAVGWNWGLTLAAAGHDVVVLTRTKNKPLIEAFLEANPRVAAPKFIYFDLPEMWVDLQLKRKLPEQIYYQFWQLLSARTALAAHRLHPFDLAWHITFGQVRQPSPLWQLGCPFIFGPVGGGERAPWRMRTDYPLRGHIRDAIRDALNWLIRIDPWMRKCFEGADLIIARTPETQRAIPKRFRSRSIVMPEIGIDQVDLSLSARFPNKERRFLFVGRFIDWKGVTLAVRAFAEYIRLGGVGRLTLVGRGHEKNRATRLARSLGVHHLIDWIEWIERRDLGALYREYDLFVFPSLHDSGGTVVLEALSKGLPVICFDLGGPPCIVGNSAGWIIATDGCGAVEAATKMGRRIKMVFDDPDCVPKAREAALKRAREFLWENRVAKIMPMIQNIACERKNAVLTSRSR